MVAFLLKDIFTNASSSLLIDQDKINNSETETDADSIDNLSLEYHDNPFTSFLRKLETLIEENPEEAYLLLQMVLSDKLFDSDKEFNVLGKKLDQIIETLQIEKTTEHSLTLRNSFMKSVYGLIRPDPNEEEYTPQIASAALTPKFS
jgi:hypothetical protein